MSNRDRIVFLEDIKEAIERIERGVQGQSYEDFLGDEKGMYAVFMNLAIIGEATRNIPDEVKALTGTVPGRR